MESWAPQEPNPLLYSHHPRLKAMVNRKPFSDLA
jgi:hypothetical protein